MKKFLFATILISLVAVSFIGCNKKTTFDATPSKNIERHTIKVGYAQVGHESAWRNANTLSFKTTFTPDNGYEFYFVDADGSQKAQIDAIRNFIAQNVDYIVLAPVVETGWEGILKEANDAGIPVILSDRQIKVNDDSLYLCWVGADFLQEGRNAVKWLASYLENKNLGSDEINIVNLQGTLGASAQVGRTQGLIEGIEAFPNWNLIAQKSGNFTTEGGKKAMQEIIKSVGINKINVLFSENDDMTLGAIEVIKEAGKVPGDDIIIISFDAVYKAFMKLIAGEINCECECNPLHGSRVAEVIRTLESGKPVEKIQYVNESIFDHTNAQSVMLSRRY